MIQLFYQPVEADRCLGSFHLCEAADLPEAARRLLAHNDHMTITLEAAVGCPVDLEVLKTTGDLSNYARKIVLKSQADQTPVMFGIVTVNLDKLDPPMQSVIKSATIPLGRILIESDLLRRVSLANLYRIEPGYELAQALDRQSRTSHNSPHETSAGINTSREFYGRTAIIFLDGQSVVELLEIVAI